MENKTNKKGTVAVIALAVVILLVVVVSTVVIANVIKGKGGVLSKENTTEYTLAGATNNNEEKSTVVNWDETEDGTQGADGDNAGNNIGNNADSNSGGNVIGNNGGNANGNNGGSASGNSDEKTDDKKGGLISGFISNLFGGFGDKNDDGDRTKGPSSQNSNSNTNTTKGPSSQNSNSNTNTTKGPSSQNSNSNTNTTKGPSSQNSNSNTNTTKGPSSQNSNSNTNTTKGPSSQNSNSNTNTTKVPSTTKKPVNNDVISEYEDLTKNGDNVLSDHHKNQYIKLVSEKYGIAKELLVAIYSVPDTGNNFVLEFSGKRNSDGNVIKSPDTLTKVYQIDKNKNITIATGKVKGNVGVSYAESVLCFNMITNIVMPQYPDYFTGVEK